MHVQDEADVDGPPSDVVDQVSECMKEQVHDEAHVDRIHNVHASRCPRDVCLDDEWLVEPHADVDGEPSEAHRPAQSLIEPGKCRPPTLGIISNLQYPLPLSQPNAAIPKEEHPDVDGEPSGAPRTRKSPKQPSTPRPPSLDVVHNLQYPPPKPYEAS